MNNTGTKPSIPHADLIRAGFAGARMFVRSNA